MTYYKMDGYNNLIDLVKENYQSIFPPIELCGDNAAMIAMRGIQLKNSDNYEKGFGVFSSIKKLV